MKSFRQTVLFKAAPAEVYEMLMDARKHAAFTGAKARIGREIGETFSVYDGYARGYNLDLVPNKLIVQSWRGSDWPAGHFSKTVFELIPIKGGTKLRFAQTRVPDDQADPIKAGWKEHYWDKMKAWLARAT
jgi:activator of HSP90 ATPase